MIDNTIESKRRNSLLNAFSSITYTLVNGFLSIIVTRIVLYHYGSDYNGLNSSANQLISLLLVLESGFTIASNVALFSPLSNKNIELVNKIISTTNLIFRRIGYTYFSLGLLIILFYSRIIKSSIPYYEIFTILIISLIPTTINFIFAVKYNVLFQSIQHEYVLNIMKIISCIIGNISVIIAGCACVNRIFLRILLLLNPIILILITILVGRRKFKNINFHYNTDIKLIPGTKDLMIQKFVGLAYSASPTLIMSARIGTIAISIFGIYNGIILLMKSFANAFINSPRMSLGVLISENTYYKTKRIFREYENIVMIIASIMTICYFSLIIPFISLYTKDINDATYINYDLALYLGIIFFIECLHIPSGIFLNMIGLFKVSKVIQLIAALVLCISLTICFYVGTIISFVISILIAASTLSFMEVGYVHFKSVMNGKSMDEHFIIDLFFYTLFTTCMSYIVFNINFKAQNYITMIIYGIAILLFTCLAMCILLYIIKKELLFNIITFIRTIIKHR